MFGLISTPGGAEPVQLREVEDPRPSEDEALVEVKAFGVNRGELFLLAERDGWRPGQDVAGVVLQPAASGRGPGAGARVVACVDGGGWAQRVAAPVTRMAGLPDSVSFSAAATLPVAGLTALRALREVGDLLGRRVLVTGASGGVGHFGVQLAAIGGATVTAAAGRPEVAERLKELGAGEVVTYDADFGGPFAGVLESVGGTVLESSLQALAAGGVAVLYGSASGQPARITLRSFGGHHGASIRGFYIYQTGVETFGEDLAYLVGLIAARRLRPEVGLELSWRETARAVQALRERKVTGKAVLLVD
ncbi:MAG TPA: zinc-binding dehydrogenase [Candidatus Dormibacteraeota bacterium]